MRPGRAEKAPKNPPNCGCGKPLYAPGMWKFWVLTQHPRCAECQARAEAPPRPMTAEECRAFEEDIGKDVAEGIRRFDLGLKR